MSGQSLVQRGRIMAPTFRNRALLASAFLLCLSISACSADDLEKPTSRPSQGNASPLLRLKKAVCESDSVNYGPLDNESHTEDHKSRVEVGNNSSCVGLVSLKEAHAKKVVDFFEPGVTLLTSFLPAFFIPALVVSPLSLSSISGLDAAKFFGAISVGIPLVYFYTGRMVELLQYLQGTGTKPDAKVSKPAATAQLSLPFSSSLERLMTVATLGSGAVALAKPEGPAKQIFYSIATIYSFVFSSRLPRLLHPLVARYWHPLLSSFCWTSALLGVFGALHGTPFFATLREYFVPGGGPMSAAGNHVLFWLEPSIITFAFGLYSRKKLLFDNALPILGGAFTATVLGIFTMAGLGRLLAPSRTVRLALLPRATAALAVVQAATIGANAPLTAVNCCYTGIFGANFGVTLLDALRLVDPIARGVATGGGGLALASAALSTLDPAAFPFGALGMSLTSAMATVLFCVPQFSKAVLAVAGV